MKKNGIFRAWAVFAFAGLLLVGCGGTAGGVASGADGGTRDLSLDASFAGDSAWSDLAVAASDLAQGASDLATHAPDLNPGALDLVMSAQDLNQGAPDLETTTEDLTQGASDLAMSTEDLEQGVLDLAMSTADLEQGALDLAMNAEDLNQGAPDLSVYVPDLARAPDLAIDAAPVDHGADAQSVDASADLGGGCFMGTPMTNEQFLNACNGSVCQSFDNSDRLPLLNPDGTLPPLPM